MDITGGMVFTGGITVVPYLGTGNKAIFGYGNGPSSITNLVSNLGIVANDTVGVGTSRAFLAAGAYG